MKEKVLILLISLIGMITVGILFQYGEKIVHRDAVEGYSTLYFNFPDCSVTPDLKDINALKFTIHNLNEEDCVYHAIFLINNEEIEASEQNICGKEKRSISPPKTVMRELQKLELNDSFEYTVVVEHNGSKQIISKQVTIYNE